MQDSAEHRHRRIKNTNVLPEDIGGCQRVQRDGTRVASFIFHQRAQEVHRTVVQGAVVGVVADAVVVEGEKGIDGGNRCCGGLVPALAGLGGGGGGCVEARQFGRERGGKDGGDIAGGPIGLHAIREAHGIVNDEYIRIIT